MIVSLDALKNDTKRVFVKRGTPLVLIVTDGDVVEILPVNGNNTVIVSMLPDPNFWPMGDYERLVIEKLSRDE